MTESSWSDFAPASAIPEGGYRVGEVGGVAVVVFRVDGCLHAYENVCTHDYGELMRPDGCWMIDRGRLEGREVYCPRHGARFDVRTGVVLAPPAFEGLRRHGLRVVAGMVQVRGPDAESP
ncbi:MAG: Rieske 2Fe-2S domain-containing protein [Ectothiorhodospiraceae bacterium]|nr:Rieske 2Fe-2S domain-containing protein [Ectothiorhodospiraceae bacterium]